MLAFGLFGGAGLSIVPEGLRLTVVGISIAVTGGFTLLAGGAELITERDLAGPGALIMAGGMAGGMGLFVVGWILKSLGVPFAGAVYLAAFALVVIGWIGDLIHEISVLSRDDRNVFVNAFGLYAAVTGVLVHIIWIVARSMGDD